MQYDPANDPVVRAAVIERLSGNESGPANRWIATLDLLRLCRPTLTVPGSYCGNPVSHQTIATDAVLLLLYRDFLVRFLRDVASPPKKPFFRKTALEGAYRFAAVLAHLKTVAIIGMALDGRGRFDVERAISQALSSVTGLRLCRCCGRLFKPTTKNGKTCTQKCEKHYKQNVYKWERGPSINAHKRRKRLPGAIHKIAEAWSEDKRKQVEAAALAAAGATGVERDRLATIAARIAVTKKEQAAADRLYAHLTKHDDVI